MTFEYNEQEVLYHYGVMGMKWGIRRDRRGQTISKSFGKLNKLDKKYTKANDVYTSAKLKYQTKLNKLQKTFDKSKKKYYKEVNGFRGVTEKSEKMKAVAKSDQAALKKHQNNTSDLLSKEIRNTKAEASVKTWVSQMNKNIGNMKMSEVPEEMLQLGKKYFNLIV